MRVASIPAMPASPTLAPVPDPHAAPPGTFAAADGGATPTGSINTLQADGVHPSPAREPDEESTDGAFSVATVSMACLNSYNRPLESSCVKCMCVDRVSGMDESAKL